MSRTQVVLVVVLAAFDVLAIAGATLAIMEKLQARRGFDYSK
jgi:hypothetical protein